MTVVDHTGLDRPAAGGPPGWRLRADPATLLPQAEPLRRLGTEAGPVPDGLDPELARALYRTLVLGRRFNAQATALTRQGRLAVYPSTTGQEGCEVGAALALGERDWLFPSYRDTLAVVARGVDPVEALTLLRGDAHCGYDPRSVRVAPLCTPLANQAVHAAGLAHAASLSGDPVAALAMLGDGGTSEGDFHEALNFAAVRRAPAVFFVQNNGYAISVPLEKQTAAPSLAHKAVGYGMPGVLVDGNDVLAVHEVVTEALRRARTGGGPTLIEAVTYRMEAHTNADDAGRYRPSEEAEPWLRHDPVLLAEYHMKRAGLVDAETIRQAGEEADQMARDLRTRLNEDPVLDPMSLFDHVYATRTGQLREQADQLAAELAAAEHAEWERMRAEDEGRTERRDGEQ